MGAPAKGDLAVRISRWALLWLLVIGVLIAVEVAVITGFITPGDVIGSFLTFVFALMVISVLSIVGAVFVGMFVSHRILSTKGFTPFEQEMLHMRREVGELRQQIERIAERLGAQLGDEKKEP